MKHFRSSVLTIAFAALFSMPMEPAIAKQQCSASMPSGSHGYWSWRLIDGRKCWYEGKPMLSKSSLEWSARPAIKADAEEEVVASTLIEKPGSPLDAQAKVIDADSRTKAIGSETFDAMWRARVGR